MGFLRSGGASGSLSGPFGKSKISLHLILTHGAAYALIDLQFLKSVPEPTGLPAIVCATICGKYVNGHRHTLDHQRPACLPAYGHHG